MGCPVIEVFRRDGKGMLVINEQSFDPALHSRTELTPKNEAKNKALVEEDIAKGKKSKARGG